MKIRQAKVSDFSACARITEKFYPELSNDSFPVDRYSLMQMFIGALNRDCYFKVMLERGEIIGWMLAIPDDTHPASTVKSLQHMYLHMNRRGLYYCDLILDWFEDLHYYAEMAGYESVTVNLPDSLIHVMLQSYGWQPYKEILCRVTRHFKRDRRPGPYNAEPRANQTGPFAPLQPLPIRELLRPSRGVLEPKK